MSGFDPDAWQDMLRTPNPDDDVPITMTYHQALKCAALVDAFVQGHEGYRDEVRMVGAFLRAAAFGVGRGAPARIRIRPSVEDAWAVIDAAPWPRSGPPRDQHA